MSKTMLELKNIGKTFTAGKVQVEVLKDVNLQVAEGEIVALLGPSGCGKSTLLHIAGILTTPTEGEVIIDGLKVTKLSDNERTKMRLEKIGFVYQAHHLLSDFTAIENVMLPELWRGENKLVAQKRAQNLLEQVGLKKVGDKKPFALSGGERQRVGIARALINSPKLILADEPTGNLDPHNSDLVFASLLEMAHKNGTATLIVTHNYELAKLCDRIVKLGN